MDNATLVGVITIFVSIALMALTPLPKWIGWSALVCAVILSVWGFFRTPQKNSSESTATASQATGKSEGQNGGVTAGKIEHLEYFQGVLPKEKDQESGFNSKVKLFVEKVEVPNRNPIKLKKRTDGNPNRYAIGIKMTNETSGIINVDKVCVSIDSVSFHTSYSNWDDPPTYGKRICALDLKLKISSTSDPEQLAEFWVDGLALKYNQKASGVVSIYSDKPYVKRKFTVVNDEKW